MIPQPGFVPNVMTLGSGARRCLALHCTMAFGGAWSGFAKALPNLTLIAPDMPSHGRSPDWDEISNFGETVFQAGLSAMEGTPIDVIGHSFGAVTALRIAVQAPEKVRSVTLIEPVFFAVALADAPDTMGHHEAAAKPFADALAAGDMETAARAFNRMWSTGGPAWDTIPERNRAAMVRAIHVVPDTYDLLYHDEAGLLELGALDAVQVPTLLLRGEYAHPAIMAVNDGLTARMPNATQAVIQGAGHMAPITHSDAAAEAVQSLLARD